MRTIKGRSYPNFLSILFQTPKSLFVLWYTLRDLESYTVIAALLEHAFWASRDTCRPPKGDDESDQNRVHFVDMTSFDNSLRPSVEILCVPYNTF